MISIESGSILANVVLLLDRLWYSENELIEILAQRLFEKVDDHVLITYISEHFLINLLYANHEKFIPFITRLLESDDAEINKKGGELATRTYIFHKTKLIQEIFQRALRGNVDSRKGVAVISNWTLKYSEHIEFGVKILADLFNDNSEAVRENAAFCFHFLSRSEQSIKLVETLLENFVDSRSFFEHPTELFKFLYEYELPLIEQSLKIIDQFVQFCVTGKAENIPRYSYISIINKLILRIYAMSSNTRYQNGALRLINKMYENNMFDKNNFIEFER
jgi:hypothetical protein